MSILTECLQRAEQQAGIATTGLECLHKLQSMIIAAKNECKTVIDHENALHAMYGAINGALVEIDRIMGVDATTPPTDHTDLEQDRDWMASANVIPVN